MSVRVVIPARDEAPTIAGVVAEVRRRLPEAWILVVDDGSVDATAALARAGGAECLSLGRTGGYGAAVRAGLARALEHGDGPLVLLDADGQHEPALLPALLEPVFSGRADLAIGSRRRQGGPWVRRIGRALFSFGVWAATGRRILDVVSGFKAFTPEAARALLALPYRDAHAEVLVPLIRRGLKIVEVPVPSLPRLHGRSMYTWRSSAGYVWETAFLMARAMRR